MSVIEIARNKSFKHVTINIDGIDYDWTVPNSFGDGEIEFGMRRELYPGQPNIKSLPEMESWIADGHKVDGEVIPKIEWEGTHPRTIKLKKDLSIASSIQERLTILEDYLLEE